MAVTLKGSAAELMGLSTDSKPSDPDLNTIFHELDTGKMYYYDGTDWAEGVESSGGSGGGGGSSSGMVVTLSKGTAEVDGDTATTYTMDKTWKEITDYMKSGNAVTIVNEYSDWANEGNECVGVVNATYIDDYSGQYIVVARAVPGQEEYFSASGANSYPVYYVF